jgi:hypothetical protein
MTQTLPGEAYLNKVYIEQTIMEYLEPYLAFNEVLQPVDISQAVFNYKKREMTVSQQITDEIMGEPVPGGEFYQFNEVQLKNISQEDGRSYRLGYEIAFTRDDLMQTDIVDEYEYGLQAMGFGIAMAVNKMILAGFISEAAAGTASIDYVWGSETGKQNPLGDLRKMYFAHKSADKPQRITDFYQNTENVQELLDYCDSRDIEWNEIRPDVYQIAKNPVRGYTIHDVNDMIDEGHSLNLDQSGSRYVGATLYRTFDPKFIVQKANDKQLGDPTALHINIVEDDSAPHLTKIEAWLQMGLAIKEPSVIQYQDGL